MKKSRLIALFLTLAMMFSLCAAAAPEAEKDSQTNAVTDAATFYLKEAAYATYLYEDRNLEQLTITSVSEEEKIALVHETAGYAAFRSNQKAVPYTDANIDFGEISTLEENLTLHREYVAFYGHINELEKTTYKYFAPAYKVLNVEVNGNLAIVDVYETLDFQYSECDEPSAITTHYYVSLVNNGGQWLVMAVESDDLFYESYRESGFDLEKEIASVDAAYAHEEVSLTAAETPAENVTQTPLRHQLQTVYITAIMP